MLPRHADQLRASSIDPAVAVARGYRSVTSKSDLERLGFSAAQSLVPALLVPIHGVDGHVVLRQVKPDSPRTINGKVVKYETPRNARMVLDVPPAARAQLGDLAVRLIITEGVKKADAAVSRGLCAVALLGVWNWRGTNTMGGKTALADWECIALEGREVLIVFDSDVTTKPAVQEALRRLVAFLEMRRAHVAVIQLPPGPYGAKVGLDDYFAAGRTVEDLFALRIAQAYADPPPRAAPADDESSTAAAAEPFSELWFARLLAAQHKQDLRWVAAWHSWMVWTALDGCWRVDDTGEVMRRAEGVATVDLPSLANEYAVASGCTTDAAIGRAVQKLLHRFQSKIVLEHCIALARAEPGIAAPPDVWDTRTGLLCVANGTLDLRTGELRPSLREDYITKRCPVAFDAAATCPTFDAFLLQVQPDVEIREYLRRAFGYSAIGDPREHLLHVLWGAGANGKTTLVEAIRIALGSYAGTAPSKLLLTARGERHPTDVTTLFGKRLVVCSETPEDGRLDESLMKGLTGGDRITARRMREDFWEFDPTHSLWLLTNHRPRIVGTDEGVWRRLRLIPFNVSIPKSKQDRQLLAKLRVEVPGILAWVVRGAREYCQMGLEAPAAMRVATDEYRSGEDVLGQYIDERIEPAPGAFLASLNLHADYSRWCSEVGITEARRLSQASLTKRLRDRGFRQDRNKARRGFAEIALRDSPAVDRSMHSDAAAAGDDAWVTPDDAPSADASPRNSLASNVSMSVDDAMTPSRPSQSDIHARAHLEVNAKLASSRHQASPDPSLRALSEIEKGAADRMEPCPSCFSRRFWHSIEGGPLVCLGCHPPPGGVDQASHVLRDVSRVEGGP